ncbi:MAG: hypothetical protein PHY75_02465 [Bacteroidales bacterium]|nr:hypothetical protein [Bacteroidales bacterium]
MRKSLIPLIITFLSLIGNNCFAQTFGGGNGTVGNPYQISTKGHLDSLRIYVNRTTSPITFSGKYFIMTADIDLSNSVTPVGSFIPIGYNATTNNFRGNFNGGNYKIRMSKITSISNSRAGLFGYTKNATIENVKMELDSINITSKEENNYTGFLIAYADSTIINNCNIGDSTDIYYSNLFKNNIIGGMIGYAYNCTITLSSSLCSIRIISQGNPEINIIGGLIGKAVNSTINNCFTRNDIYTTNQTKSYIGGLVGTTQNSSFSNSYSAPTSFNSGFQFTGIIVSDTSAKDSNVFDNCYYLTDTAVHAGSEVGTGLTITQMSDTSFMDSLNNGQYPPVWDFEGGLPYIAPSVDWSGGGSGKEDDPYIIRYVKDLITLSNSVSKGTKFNNRFLSVVSDISFNNGVIDSSSLFIPIGNITNNNPFSGTIKGNGFAIANYKYSNDTTDNVGLFGYTLEAVIKGLGISNVSIKARNNVGGLVAITNKTIIDSCFVYGNINGVRNVGGLVGLDTVASTINRSFTNTTIDALTNVGGIAGNYKGTISNCYSNSEIYSSTIGNNYVGGIIGLASASASYLSNIYSACKIIRNGTNTNFGKIKGNNSGTNINCFSRDSVFVNYSNSSTTGYNGTQKTNAELRSSGFVSTLNGTNSYWIHDYSPDSINDGYPILKYQPAAVKPNSSGLWPTTTASQVVVIKNGVQLKANSTNYPKCAYVKIEAGGELNNTTNINLFGEYNRELYVGKWNLIGLSTYNRILSCLYNYTDSISFKTFVKRFNYTSNNWSTTTTQDINTQFNFGEGILVMPNYSLDARLIIKSRIVAKGVLYNDTTLSYTFNNTSTATNKFVSLANNYPASLDTALLINNNSSLIQGRLIYVYDADSGKWNNNLSSNVRVTSLKPSEGFFIASSSASGIFNFKKSQIKNTSGAKNLIKSDLIYVQAIVDNNVRESFLEFNEEADNAFDFEDGLMLFGNNYNSVEPFFTIPTPEINDSTTQLIKDAFSSLPYTTELDLRSQKTNEVSINFSNIPSNIHVYLLDSLLNKAQYLNEEPNYNLQVNEGDNVKRLYVLFSYYKEDINDFFKPEVAQEIKIWNYNNNLNIEGRDLIRYELFDIMGNKLLEEEILDDRFKTQLDLESGIYIVRAFSSSSSKAQKISISRK